MFHLRKRILPLLHSPSPLLASSLASLDRLLSTTTTSSTSPTHFSVEDYLVTTCHLTPAQVLKVSKKLSHLKSPSKPDAALAFLASLGLSRSDVAAVVVADPCFLCADVEKTLAPRVAELLDLGLSRPQIASLIPHARASFRTRSLGRNVGFWLPVFGSYDKLLVAVNRNSSLLGADLDRVAKPNLALLQQCGLSVRDIAHVFLYHSRLLTMNHKLVQDAVARTDELGVDRGSRMFGHALTTLPFFSRDRVADRIRLLEKHGWSKDDILVAMKKAPKILSLCDERVQRIVKFLTQDVGLETPYIARRPALLMYSIDRRLLPRHSLLKVLIAKGLLDGEGDFYVFVSMAEEKFLRKFVYPYKDSVPGLTDAYVSSFARKTPIRTAP